MKSKVYFTSVGDDDIKTIARKFSGLLDAAAHLLNFLRKGEKTAVKIHFGEEGNTGFVRPEYVKELISRIIKLGARPFLADTNALYKGERAITKDHLNVAARHGFTQKAVGAKILIADTSSPDSRVASLFTEADSMIAVSHFKGHLYTGFGGAIKNLGMGCATKEGKLFQHTDIRPVVNIDACTGCGLCIKACPAGAIKIANKKAQILADICIGCGECVGLCQKSAININMDSGVNKIQERMAESTKAAIDGKEKKTAFFNFAIKISRECDCWTKDFPFISPNVGIFASSDIVSIDKACYDMIIKKCKKNVFLEAHPGIDGMRQLNHACKLGLGSLEYNLIEV